VSLSGLMEEFTKVNIIMIRRKVLGFLVGPMARSTLECGRKVNRMAKVLFLIRKDKLGVGFGKEAEEYVGIMKFINGVKRINNEIVIVIII
jgi:hypothetical protein